MNISMTLRGSPMENEKFINLGKNFYDWYKSNKLKLVFKDTSQALGSEVKRVDELMVYVKEKKDNLIKQK